MFFSEAREVFISRCTSERLSDHTLKAYSTDTKQFQTYLEDPDLEKLCKEDILKFHQRLLDRGFKQTTIKRKIATIKAMFAFLEREEMVSANLLRTVSLKLRLPKRLPKNIPKSELRKLIKHARLPSEREQRYDKCSADQLRKHTTLLSVELMLCTGVRVGELVAICVSDIDLPGARIRVKGKGARERFVFLPNQEVSSHLQRYIRDRSRFNPPDENLLINSRGMPASTQYIRKLISDLTTSAKIPRRITPHMFRHSAASELVESGVDIRFIQKLLGHQSISTTEIYTHLNDDTLLRRLQKADVLSALS